MGPAQFDSLLERANQALEKAAAQPTDAEGSAAGAGGLVQARISSRRVEFLQIDPRAVRLGAAELAAEIQDTVNRAFDALPGADVDGSAARSAGQALAGELREIQNESMRSMTMFVQSVRDAVSRLEQGRSRQ
jgi:3-oxoacyl-ACP reductase-like protein